MNMRDAELKDIKCIRDGFFELHVLFLRMHYVVVYSLLLAETVLLILTAVYPGDVFLLIIECAVIGITTMLQVFPLRSFAAQCKVAFVMASAALLSQTSPPKYVWDMWFQTPTLFFTHPAMKCITKPHYPTQQQLPQ